MPFPREVLLKHVRIGEALSLLFVFFCAVGLPRAQDAAETSAAVTIRALEQEWTAAQARNDNRALNLIFDNAVVYVEYGRLISKGDYLSRIRQKQPELDQIAMEPMAVRLFGNTAIVIGTYTEKQFHGGRNQVKHWRFIDTWVYKKSGWVLVSAGAAPITK